jgi:hypothetical protein
MLDRFSFSRMDTRFFDFGFCQRIERDWITYPQLSFTLQFLHSMVVVEAWAVVNNRLDLLHY